MPAVRALERLRAFLLNAVLASAALAEPTTSVTTPGKVGGVNLSWGDCGAAGRSNLEFACSTDTTMQRLVASYVAPAGVAGFLGLSAQLTVSTSAALPDFWKHGADFCRGGTALASSFDFTRDSSCADFFYGGAVGGHAVIVGGVQAANRATILLQCAVPLDSKGPLKEGREYYAFALSFAAPRAAAGDTCRGCEVPACITLDQIQLFQPPEAHFDPILAKPSPRSHVTWQGGPAACPGTPAVAGKPWGQVKTIHR